MTILEVDSTKPLIRRSPVTLSPLIITMTFCLVLYSRPNEAHHQLGLPHYLYSGDSPQIPTMAIDADAEGYDLTFSIYPGNPLPGNEVKIAISIRKKATQELYPGPLSIAVAEMTFFGGEELLEPSRPIELEEKEYNFSFVFPRAEQYLVRCTFNSRPDMVEIIDFPVMIGSTDFNPVPLVFIAGLVLVFVAIGLGKRRLNNNLSLKHDEDIPPEMEEPER